MCDVKILGGSLVRCKSFIGVSLSQPHYSGSHYWALKPSETCASKTLFIKQSNPMQVSHVTRHLCPRDLAAGMFKLLVCTGTLLVNPGRSELLPVPRFWRNHLCIVLEDINWTFLIAEPSVVSGVFSTSANIKKLSQKYDHWRDDTEAVGLEFGIAKGETKFSFIAFYLRIN